MVEEEEEQEEEEEGEEEEASRVTLRKWNQYDHIRLVEIPNKKSKRWEKTLRRVW